MKKALRILAFIVIGLLLITGALVSYVKFALPDVGPAPDLKVKITPARVERGKYLANHVTVCIDCHSKRDWTKFAGPPSIQLGTGGEKFDRNAGLPGEIYSANITPYHLKNWTDGELFRAITTGVKKDGSAIFPIMPYQAYGKMDKEDIYSIIAYIRTLPEQESTQPERQLDFPVNLIVNTIPVKATFAKIPAESDTLAYGAYLVSSAACVECHTKAEKGNLIKGMEFAGGRDFKFPGGTVYSANITQDTETGIGKWTKQQFIARFKMYADSSYHPVTVGAKDFQTVMPWMMFSGMKDNDLAAIYAYLKTIKPITNQVTKFVPAGNDLAMK